MVKKGIIIFIVLASSLSSASSSNRLAQEIERILAMRFFNTTTTAIEIYNLSKKRTIYSKNAKLLLHPASNQKILTSIAALCYLDSSYMFDTVVGYNGTVVDSVCKGNLYIIGGGDPSLTEDDLDTFAFLVKNFGINKIEGNLYGDVSMFDSLHWGTGWMWDDDPRAFSPYLTPLIVDKSSVKILYQPGETGQPVNVEIFPKSNSIKLINESITIEKDSSNLTITRDWLNRKNEIIVNGTLSKESKPDSVFRNLYAPYKIFLKIFNEKLARNGVMLTGRIDTLQSPQILDTLCIHSQPIDTVLYYMNKESDNLNAEMVLRALANKHFGKRASSENGTSVVDSLINKIGLNPYNYTIADGSGLSYYNLISVELLTEAIKHIYYKDKKAYKRFYNTLPIAGVDGTLENRSISSGCTGNLRAKTGTLSGISALTGIVKSKRGDDILFSILIQNYVAPSRTARYFQDRISKIIYDEL